MARLGCFLHTRCTIYRSKLSKNWMADLLTLLINLDGSEQRLASADRQLRAQSVPYERYRAHDARGRDPNSYDQYNERHAIRYYGRPLTGGEIGCYLSHLGCAERVVQSHSLYGLVLEDDFRFEPDAMATIRSAISWLEADGVEWDLINLGRSPQKIYTPLAQLGDRQLCLSHYFPTTATGLLWSRAGAEKFLSTSGEIFAPVDHFFRKWCSANDSGLALVPAPISTTGTGSEIDAIDSSPLRRKEIGKTPIYFLREARRQFVIYSDAYLHYWLPKKPRAAVKSGLYSKTSKSSR